MSTTDFNFRIQNYTNLLHSFAFQLTRNRDDSADLYQDTLIKAVTNLEKFTEGTNFKAWLCTIMRNTFINDYRKKQRRNTLLDTSDNQYLLNSGTVTVNNDSKRSFLREDISKAMEQVHEKYLCPFNLYYEGYQYEEIAEKLNIPLGTVKSRIYFARKELQKNLATLGITSSAN